MKPYPGVWCAVLCWLQELRSLSISAWGFLAPPCMASKQVGGLSCKGNVCLEQSWLAWVSTQPHAALQCCACCADHALPQLCGNQLLLLPLPRLPLPAEGNIMLNDLVESTVGTAILYSSMLVYLALGMTTTQYALRQSLDTIFFGEGAGFTWRRHVSGCTARVGACSAAEFCLAPHNGWHYCAGPCPQLAADHWLSVCVCTCMQVLMTTLTVGTSLTVALLVPDKAEKIYAVVGATAVCVVCYVIPVFIQLQRYRRQRRRAKRRWQQVSEVRPQTGLQFATALCRCAVTQACAHASPTVSLCVLGMPCPLLQAHLADQEAQLAAGLLAHEAAPVGDAAGFDPAGVPALSPRMPPSSAWEVLQEVVLPVFILLLGVGFSIAALWVAVSAFV